MSMYKRDMYIAYISLLPQMQPRIKNRITFGDTDRVETGSSIR